MHDRILLVLPGILQWPSASMAIVQESGASTWHGTQSAGRETVHVRSHWFHMAGESSSEGLRLWRHSSLLQGRPQAACSMLLLPTLEDDD